MNANDVIDSFYMDKLEDKRQLALVAIKNVRRGDTLPDVRVLYTQVFNMLFDEQDRSRQWHEGDEVCTLSAKHVVLVITSVFPLPPLDDDLKCNVILTMEDN